MTQHTFVLSRRVGRTPHLVERALPELARGRHGELTFVGPFQRWALVGPWGSGPTERRAHAELRTGRHSHERVEVELGPWDRQAVELRIRPVARRPERWSGRRQARYFDGAHASVDALARAIGHAVPVPPAAVPATRSA